MVKQSLWSKIRQALDPDKPTPFGDPTYCAYCHVIMYGRGVNPESTHWVTLGGCKNTLPPQQVREIEKARRIQKASLRGIRRVY